MVSMPWPTDGSSSFPGFSFVRVILYLDSCNNHCPGLLASLSPSPPPTVHFPSSSLMGIPSPHFFAEDSPGFPIAHRIQARFLSMLPQDPASPACPCPFSGCPSSLPLQTQPLTYTHAAHSGQGEYLLVTGSLHMLFCLAHSRVTGALVKPSCLGPRPKFGKT